MFCFGIYCIIVIQNNVTKYYKKNWGSRLKDITHSTGLNFLMKISMYNNYIFDLYGTLVDINTDEKSSKLWKKLSLFYSFNGAVYKSNELKKAYIRKVEENIGDIHDTAYPDFPIERVFKSLYLDKSVIADESLIRSTAQIFRSLSIKYIRLYDGVLELLEKLKEKNKKVYLLSNAQRIFTLYEMKILGIDKYFDDIYFSSDYCMCKPDSNFYNKLIKDKDIDVSKSIMIGNDPECDINGAKAVGLNTLFIKSNLSPKGIYHVNSLYEITDGNVCDVMSLCF